MEKLNLIATFHKTVSQQDRQCTHNITLISVRATIVVTEKQCVLYKLNVCICGLRYQACIAHSTCHQWPTQFYNIFPRDLINGKIFGGGGGGGFLNTKCVF